MRNERAAIVDLFPSPFERTWWRRFWARHMGAAIVVGAGLGITLVMLTLIAIALGGVR